MPNCAECHTPFEVSPEDKKILETLGLPLPTLCGKHSLLRKMAWRNERYLYWRTCELCGKKVLAGYSPESGLHVYCRTCWFSDQWDPTSFARAYDPERSFFEQWVDLYRVTPQSNLFWAGENQNCNFSNNLINCKDVYLSSSTLGSEGVLYSKNTDYSRDIVDGINNIKSELCYQCVDTEGAYHSAYLTRCNHCSDCYLSRNLQDCQDCFGSVNLKHKQFYWFNEKLNEEEYKKRLAEALKDRQSFQAQVDLFTQHQLNYPVEFASILNSNQSTGHDIQNSSNVRNGFNTREDENVGDVFRVYKSKDSFREAYGIGSELCYECSASPKRVRCVATLNCPEAFQVEYSMNCDNNQNLFGCVGLRGKKYHILNTPYTEEEYHKLRARIIQDMQTRGEWGEFFPVRFSPHGYNKTVAFENWSITQEEALAQGWNWQDDQLGTRGKETLVLADVPPGIDEVRDEILKEILVCDTCGLNYQLQKKELDILRSLHLNIPLSCPECRFQARLPRTYTPELYQRTCDCQLSHLHHTGKCPERFLTIYAPGRLEQVFCKDCYAAEVL